MQPPTTPHPNFFIAGYLLTSQKETHLKMIPNQLHALVGQYTSLVKIISSPKYLCSFQNVRQNNNVYLLLNKYLHLFCNKTWYKPWRSGLDLQEWLSCHVFQGPQWPEHNWTSHRNAFSIWLTFHQTWCNIHRLHQTLCRVCSSLLRTQALITALKQIVLRMVCKVCLEGKGNSDWRKIQL